MSNTLPIRILYEDWGELMVPDGTLIRFRQVMGIAVDEGTDEKGNPKFGMRTQPQFVVLGSERSRGTPRPKTKRLGSVNGWTTHGKAQSAYDVNGTTIIMTMGVKQLFRTDGIDPQGDPVFDFQHDVQLELRGPPPMGKA